MLAIDLSIPSKIIASPNKNEGIVFQNFTNSPNTLCFVYNHSNNTTTNQQNLLNFLTTIMQSINNVIILGDFDMPDIRWPSLSADSNFSALFCDLVFQHNFSQSIELPTHSHGNTLDLIITNCEDQITDIAIDSTNSCFLKSDHHLISFNVHQTSSNQPTTEKGIILHP